jgi:hypothetical protein
LEVAAPEDGRTPAAVLSLLEPPNTPLKQGVNERLAADRQGSGCGGIKDS